MVLGNVAHVLTVIILLIIIILQGLIYVIQLALHQRLRVSNGLALFLNLGEARAEEAQLGEELEPAVLLVIHGGRHRPGRPVAVGSASRKRGMAMRWNQGSAS